jgi:PPOX class probable F420-dependent enzyme
MEHFPDSTRYLCLGTFRKSGVLVPTPVWFAPHQGCLYAFSAGDAGKVKRLRNSSRVRVAPCDWRGGLAGAWTDATASLVTDAAERKAAFGALRSKYGWQMWVVDVSAWLGRKIDRRAVIRIELPG